jgi:hypothetical protein
VNETGFCIGLYWRSVRGSRVPEGMISARCRLAYLLFSGFDPAYRYHELLARRSADRLPRHKIRLVEVTHAGQRMIGVAVRSSTPRSSPAATAGRNGLHRG